VLPRRLKPVFSSARLWYVSTFARPVKEFNEEKPIPSKLFTKLVSPRDVVLEVGGRVGNATSKLATIAKFVHSVEADPNNYRMLRAYMRRYHNVRTYNFAAWNENRQGHIMITDNDSFSGVSSIQGIDGYVYSRSASVKFARLDSLVFEPAPNILAFDCEGAEIEALKGCQGILAKIDKAIIETHKMSSGYDTKSDVREILRNNSFELSEESKWVIALK